jgi:uncharacterized protein YyaL (SSP411 family)
MVRMGLIAGDDAALSRAERTLRGRAAQVAEQPFMGARLMAALDRYLHGIELVVTEGRGRETLLAQARRLYAPTLMIAGAWAAPTIRDGKTPDEDGSARAYVCRGQSCSAPIDDAAELPAAIAPPAQ